MLVHGGNFGDGVLDFSVNTNPNVNEEMMGALLAQNIDKALVYPQIDGEHLLNRISEETGVEPSRLVLGNGATDCLYRAMQVLKPATAVVIDPTFSEYRQALKNAGTQVVSLKYDLHAQADQVEEDLLEKLNKVKAEMVVICNPNNPTGHTYSPDFIKKLTSLQKAHKGYLMVDESFRFFEAMDSCYCKEDWNLIVLTSLTKYYGIPGLRIGYLSGNFSLIPKMKHQQMPWNLNGLALVVTQALMADEVLKEATSLWYQEEKKFMVEALEALDGLTVLPGRTNYLLCYLENFTGSAINDWLLLQKVPMGIRECSSFDGLSDSYIRIGLKSKEQNRLLIQGLKAYWRHHNG